jgi:hypothetical protein
MLAQKSQIRTIRANFGHLTAQDTSFLHRDFDTQ